MALETFTWRAAGGSTQGSVKLRTRSAQFGDGYRQVVQDGINNRTRSWPQKFVGDEKRIRAIQAFIDRHAGAKSFLWTPPLSEQGRFRIEEYTPVVEAGGVYSLSATFVESFTP